jgi:NitT/TauT family transport system ATP-binding protein
LTEQPVSTTVARRATKVRLRGVTKRFQVRDGELLALADVSLDIADGEFVAVVGPSGCGKSTLLRIIADLYEPSAGEVDVVRSAPDRAATAMVFQEHALFPWLTARANVMFGPRNRGVPKAEAGEVADAQLTRLGLSRFTDYYPHQLSGGMKQRVGLARALAQNPEILLMDEPLGALDAQTRTLLQEQILELRAETHATTIYVTHAIDEAVFLADRVVLMTARPGRVKEEIPVDLPGPKGPHIRGTAAFARLTQEIWVHLRDEVVRGMQADVGT